MPSFAFAMKLTTCLKTYWQLVLSLRKFDPLSDANRYVLSAIDPGAVPAVRMSEIVAGGNWQVATPSEVSRPLAV